MDRINILVAEDDKDDYLMLRDSIKEILPKFNINHARDGKEFLEIIQQNFETDLVFLDLNMPKKNGIDCLIEIRRNQRLNSLRIITYSTSSEIEDIDECYKNGCTLYLVKPDTYKDLVTQVRKVFFRLGLPKNDLKHKELFVVKKQKESL